MSAALRDQLARDESLPAWVFIGPLDEGMIAIRLMSDRVVEKVEDGAHHIISEKHRTDGFPGRYISAHGDTPEEAWRLLIGNVLGRDQPFPDDALPGETVTDFRDRVGPSMRERAQST